VPFSLSVPAVTTIMIGHDAPKHSLLDWYLNITMNEQQVEFYNSMRKVVGGATDVSLDVVTHNDPISHPILIGDNGKSPATGTKNKHTIDIGDVAVWGPVVG